LVKDAFLPLNIRKPLSTHGWDLIGATVAEAEDHTKTHGLKREIVKQTERKFEKKREYSRELSYI